jgi:BMFP domain-containing protein YqiC
VTVYETRHEYEQRIEIAGLKAKVLRLEARAVEDARHAEKRLEMEIHLATHKDVAELEEHIAELQARLAEDDAVVDRICVYLRRRDGDGS